MREKQTDKAAANGRLVVSRERYVSPKQPCRFRTRSRRPCRRHTSCARRCVPYSLRSPTVGPR
ncbi:hypothetical protein CSE45_2396 [Citreicella sp. SE45]|nr:hypothetical protein CSE45_2396 [Citreicella sp. SE45]